MPDATDALSTATPPPPEPGGSAIEQVRGELLDKAMSFGAHLDELRRRMIYGLLGIAPIFILTLIYGDDLMEIILRPAQSQLHASGLPAMLIATNPLETLGAWLKISGVFTIVLGVPFLLYQLWRFIAPGLYEHERRFARFLVPLSAALSMLGLLFLYFVMLPAMLAFLIGFGSTLGTPSTHQVDLPPGIALPQVPALMGDPKNPAPGSMWINLELDELRVAGAPPAETPENKDATAPQPVEIRGTPLHKSSGIAQQFKVSEYVSLVFTMSLAFAGGFQTPVVVLLLGWIGIVDPKVLRRSRRYAVFICFLIAAILTPSPDPFNMTLLAVPLYLLFELGLLLLRFFPPARVSRGWRWRDLTNPARESNGAADE
jgi:sec-independent protein translocase protein TatC